MSFGALAGLVALNGGYLVVGSCILWALRGWRTWREWTRFAGLAYLLGIAVTGILWTLMLVVGIPLSALALGAGAIALAVGGLVVGRARGRRWPSSSPPIVLTKRSLVAAAGVAAAGVFFEALFRAGRLHGLYAFDAWAFWVPKAKIVYALDELDTQLLAQLPNPTYPPLVPLLDLAAFHALGGVDAVTLHVQYWFYAVAFVAAVAGLLWEHVPGWILWPFLLLALVAPRTSESLLAPQADFLLQFFVCAAVVVAFLWLREAAPWHLPAVTLLLGAAVLTKREGLLLSAILFAVLAVASADRVRTAWPRIAAAAVACASIAVPWHLWVRDHGFSGESPPSFVPERGRVWDSLELSLDVLVDPALWSLLTLLALVAIPVAAIWGERRHALFIGLLYGFFVFGGAWVSTVFTELPISADEALNPIVRYTGAVALLAAVGAPILLAEVWARSRLDRSEAR